MRIRDFWKRALCVAALTVAGCVSVSAYTGVWREQSRIAVISAEKNPERADACVSEALRATRDARKRSVADLINKSVADAMSASVSAACSDITASSKRNGGADVMDRDLGERSVVDLKASESRTDAGTR